MANQQGSIPQKLQHYMGLDNIAPELSEQDLTKLATKATNGIKLDQASSAEWNDKMAEAMKIAKQVEEGKSTPWPNAANIKYPLISSACIQFNARTNPEIIQGDKAVNVAVMIPDEQDIHAERAERLSDHMSYQLLGQSTNWRRDTDKLTMILAMVGTVYRKSYFDPIEKRPQVDLCLPSQIIINNSISSLEAAPRITHVLHLSTNRLLERMNAGIYEKYSFEELGIKDTEEETTDIADSSNDTVNSEGEAIDDELEEVYEQEMYTDLDDDYYEEPYILTIHKKSQKVLRLVARYDEEGFVFGDDGKFIKINPTKYYTDYHFIPAPDGSFLSMGFGRLLYPINSVINSTLNQLMDAATLSNRQCGYINGKWKTRKGTAPFKPGEWKSMIIPPGDRLQDGIMALPVKEPSSVLYSLLQFMIETGEKLGSISDVLLGQAPGANTPATTVMAMIEQGMKVYSSMLYRLYDSFQKEFEKLYLINKKYLAQEEKFIFATKSGIIKREDYEAPQYGVFPVLDPTISSDAMRLARAQALHGEMENPDLVPREITKRWLDALKVPNMDKIMKPEPKPTDPPSPEALQQQAELDLAHANIGNTHMQTAKILMDAELAVEQLQDKINNTNIQGESVAGTVASQKIASINNTAMTDAQVGEKQFAMAEKQIAPEEQQPPVPPVDLSGSEATLAQMQQIAGMPPPQAPQGGAPGGPGGGPPPGGGAPGGQIPPILGGGQAPEGQPPTSVAGAQAQGEEPEAPQ